MDALQLPGNIFSCSTGPAAVRPCVCLITDHCLESNTQINTYPRKYLLKDCFIFPVEWQTLCDKQGRGSANFCHNKSHGLTALAALVDKPYSPILGWGPPPLPRPGIRDTGELWSQTWWLVNCASYRPLKAMNTWLCMCKIEKYIYQFFSPGIPRNLERFSKNSMNNSQT